MGDTKKPRTEPKPLSGGAAIVTGAGGGIGRAIAVALAREGMRLVLAGRRDQALRETARLGGIEAEIVTADLAGKAGVEKLAQAAPSPLRLLVHCAALFLRGPVAATTEADWRTAAMVNVHAPMLLTAACLKALRAGRGDVVFINSLAGRLDAGAETAVYAATKHALRAAADALRQEVNKDGIRVVSLFPGRTDTPMQSMVQQSEGKSIAADRLLSPDDIAAIVIAALCLPARAEVTELVIRPSLPP
jgi:NADP-dependent 3-hydroxy acid dehydrogenase YdfG